MMNMGILDENSLNSCWLNCIVFLVDSVHISSMFLGLILGNNVLEILSG